MTTMGDPMREQIAADDLGLDIQEYRALKQLLSSFRTRVENVYSVKMWNKLATAMGQPSHSEGDF